MKLAFYPAVVHLAYLVHGKGSDGTRSELRLASITRGHLLASQRNA